MPDELISVGWRAGKVVMVDQRALPAQEILREHETPGEVAESIRAMVVRGAPAIGCAAAFGVALAARAAVPAGADEVRRAVGAATELLAATRPTAVNLFGALARVKAAVDRCGPGAGGAEIAETALAEAQAIQAEEATANRVMGRIGAELLPRKCHVLTHCNTGALATAGYGTALGVIRAAVEQGKRVRVFADETRPLLQGARLTAWELMRDGIDVTLIADGAAGLLMRSGAVDVAIVGADRIARNGDVANKIGTYTVAVLCRAHGVPFYVAAPTTTIDLGTESGETIPIEEREPAEVTEVLGTPVAPAGVRVRNPAFDVTPAHLVAAIITERGIARPPYEVTLPALLGAT